MVFLRTFKLVGLFFSVGDANRQISEYKFKLSKAEQEIGTMEQNVSYIPPLRQLHGVIEA